MFQPDQDGIYARVSASAPRWMLAYAMLCALGVLVIAIALVQPPAVFWLIFLLIFGGGVLWLAEKLRRAAQVEILLTATDIRDSAGTVLARVEDIALVDRGAFAFKPSNGFTLVLRDKQPAGWAPGLWWRLGRRVGVGGVTGAGAAKFMAEQIAHRIKDKTG